MTAATEYERYMLELINIERAAVGAPALQLELNLNTSADAHSAWMLDADIFSHTGEGGSSATQRMRDANFDLSGSWRTAENIAVQSERGPDGIMDDVYDLHVSLMNSPGHRANILNPDLDFIGIGIALGDFDFSSGTYSSVIVTQNFASTGGNVELDEGTVPLPPEPVAPPPVEETAPTIAAEPPVAAAPIEEEATPVEDEIPEEETPEQSEPPAAAQPSVAAAPSEEDTTPVAAESPVESVPLAAAEPAAAPTPLQQVAVASDPAPSSPAPATPAAASIAAETPAPTMLDIVAAELGTEFFDFLDAGPLQDADMLSAGPMNEVVSTSQTVANHVQSQFTAIQDALEVDATPSQLDDLAI